MQAFDPADIPTSPLTIDAQQTLSIPQVRAIIKALDILATKSKDDRSVPPVLKPYKNAARWFAIAVSPFLRLGEVLHTGTWAPFFEQIGNRATDWDYIRAGLENMPSDQTQVHMECFMLIKPRIPDFEAILNNFRQDPEKLLIFCSWMSKWAFNARADDSGSLKFGIVSYIPKNPDTDTVHPLIKQIANYKNLFMAKVKCGEIQINAKDLPTYLYDEDIPFDEENFDIGACRGHLIVRVYRHIFCGPKNAFALAKTGMRCKSKIYGQKGVTSRTIAYVAVQIYFTLSSADEWTQLIGKFDLQELFDAILGLFEEDEESGWTEETVKWWNNETEPDSEPTARDRVKWARQKHRQQRATRPATPTPNIQQDNPRLRTPIPTSPQQPSSPLTPIGSPPIDPTSLEPFEESQPDDVPIDPGLLEPSEPEAQLDNTINDEDNPQPNNPYTQTGAGSPYLGQFDVLSQFMNAPMAQQFLKWMSQAPATDNDSQISLYPVNLYKPPQQPALRHCQPRATTSRGDDEESQAQGGKNEPIDSRGKGKRTAQKEGAASRGKRRRTTRK
ncbi:hypothetical protein JOM56_011899 [Amanita muscaria]